MVIIIVLICVKRRKKAAPNRPLIRRRECDTYVCYDFDGNHNFVIDPILPAFEESQDPSFKSCIHSRDFEPGVASFENMFLIMIQPADTLEHLTEYMASLITKKTYLERDDRDLIRKISDSPKRVK